MSPVTVGLFTAFGVVAVGDWWAVAVDRRRSEYILKPAALAILIAAALVLDPGSDARRAWFVVALVFSLAGDVLLMIPGDRFVAGLGAFLVAHLAYIGGLSGDGGGGLDLAVAGLAVAVVAVPLSIRIIGGVGEKAPRMRGPVAAYIVVISAMVVMALATGEVWTMAGALLFYGSDALIGWSRFVGAVPTGRVSIMVTYHLGQAGLVASLVA